MNTRLLSCAFTALAVSIAMPRALSAQTLATDTARLVLEHGQARGLDPLVFGITVLVLAVFVGY